MDEEINKATRKVEALATALYSCRKDHSMEAAAHCLHTLKEVMVAVTEVFEPVLKEKLPVEMCPVCGHHLIDGECPAKKYTVNDCHEREIREPQTCNNCIHLGNCPDAHTVAGCGAWMKRIP